MSSDLEDELLSVRAAELYYDDDKTQGEIGVLLGLTRWKVGRLLAAAKDKGFVRIEIVHPRARRLPLERLLKERFGLADAMVVPAAGTSGEDDLRKRVAQAAADYLTGMRPVPRVLGISWGNTLHDVAECLRDGWAPRVNIVQINGSVTLNRRAGTAAATAMLIAQKASGNATMLPSPAILERLETKQSIEADRTVAGVLEMASGASTYLFSAGPATASSVHISSGYLSVADVDELRRRGAVGDVLGRYIDANGMIIDPELDARTVGLGLEALRAAPTSIAVIAGESKHAIARAVVASRLCTVFITDEDTAIALLENDQQ